MLLIYPSMSLFSKFVPSRKRHNQVFRLVGNDTSKEAVAGRSLGISSFELEEKSLFTFSGFHPDTQNAVLGLMVSVCESQPTIVLDTPVRRAPSFVPRTKRMDSKFSLAQASNAQAAGSRNWLPVRRMSSPFALPSGASGPLVWHQDEVTSSARTQVADVEAT